MSAQKIKIECSPSLKDAFREGVRRGLADLSIVIFITMLGGGSLVYASGFSTFEAQLSSGTFHDAVKYPLKRILIAYLVSASACPMGMAVAHRISTGSALTFY
jgi:hypothetical protein